MNMKATSIKPLFSLLPLFITLLSLSLQAQCPVGNITLTTQAEVDNFATTYPMCTNLLGSLTIGPSTDIVDLDGLAGVTAIGGTLTVAGNQGLINIAGLANLTSVGAGLIFQNNAGLITMPLPGLSSIGGVIDIRDHAQLIGFDLSSVTTHDILYMLVQNNAALTSALLPTDVTAIEQYLRYVGNPLLVNISEMNNLVIIGSYLGISNLQANVLPAFPNLLSIGLMATPGIPQGLYFEANPNIVAIPAFASLNDIGGVIHINNNAQLTDFDLSNITTHEIIYMQVRNNPVLTSALLPTDVTSIEQYLRYNNNPLLVNISEMNNLISIGNYLSISELQASFFPTFSNLLSIGVMPAPGLPLGLYLIANPNVTAIPTFASLNDIGGVIHITNNDQLTGFDLSSIITHDIIYMQVQSNPVLTSALLPTDVTSIEHYLKYFNNPLLVTISEMNNLATIGNYLEINSLQANAFPAFPNLLSIGVMPAPGVPKGLYLYSNPNVTAIPAFASLSDIGGVIHIANSDQLTDFDLSSINTHDIIYMLVQNNPVLTSALLPTDVASIEQYLRYYNNPLLVNISEMDNLATIGNYLNIHNLQANAFPAFPNLLSIGGMPAPGLPQGLYLESNPNVTAIPTFAGLNDIGGVIHITNNDQLTDFDLSSINTHDILYMGVQGNPVLTSALLPSDVTNIDQYLRYSANPVLAIISEMDHLTFIGEYLYIGNTVACALPNFPNLTNIGPPSPVGNRPTGFYIESNANISRLPTLSNSTFIDSTIAITNNPNLTYCSIQAVCDFLQGTHDRSISGNAGDCLDEAAVSAACTGNLPYPEPDMDGDGFTACEGDCDDTDPTSYPGAMEVCDGADNNCNGMFDEGFDMDGDGYTTCAGDCEDNNPNVHPGVMEVCDGIDNNCDGMIDEGFDQDGDGVTTCAGDCDDNDPNNYPGNTEICDGQDNNCDDEVDEGFDQDGDGVTVCAGDCDDNDPNNYPGNTEICDGQDNNCDSMIDEGFDQDGDGVTTCAGDCDDNDPNNYPGNTEICDGQDNNCDDEVDEGFDMDGDGVTTCEGDCDDNDPNNFPGNTEICDGQDNNCDGMIDEGFDQDGDGVTVCDGDCDDNDPNNYPGNPEVCDGQDNNCNSMTDENFDQDGDGVTVCDGDCDDNDPNNYPGNTEICDGQDNNCNSMIDEGFDQDGDGVTTCQGDCDDNDPNNYPGNTEVCDGQDNNCDDETDEGFDQDGDGYTTCEGDCDDDNPNVNPGATEICDGIDNDCDGTIDAAGLVDNEPPSVDCHDFHEVELDANGEYELAVSTIEAASSDNCGITDLSLDNDFFDCTHIGSNFVVLTATDAAGNSSNCWAEVVVQDNVPPSYSGCPGDITICEPQPVTWTPPVFSDNCAINVVPSHEPGAFITGETTVTYVATDADDNTSVCSFEIHLFDPENPGEAEVDCILPPENDECFDAILIACDQYVTGNTDDATSGYAPICEEGEGENPGAPGVWYTFPGNGDEVTASLCGSDYDTQITIYKGNCDGELECVVYNDDSACGLQSEVSFMTDMGEDYYILVNGYGGETGDFILSLSCGCNDEADLPPGWARTDIGINNGFGYANNCEGTICVESYGFALPNYDRTHFVYTSLCGDGSFTARVVSVNPSSGRGGIMFRDNHTPGSPKATLKTQFTYSTVLWRDLRMAQDAYQQSNNIGVAEHVWLRLVREGDYFKGYASQTGEVYYFLFSKYIPMEECIDIGLYVESPNINTLARACFADISITGGFGGFLQEEVLPDVVANEVTLEPLDIAVYPNPTKDEAFIEMAPFINRTASIKVWNSQGRLMQQLVVDQVEVPTQRLDLSGYASGLYVIEVEGEGLPSIIKKLSLVNH